MPETASTGRVTAYLADIRTQAEDHPLVPSSDARPLLAAVDAVLELCRDTGGDYLPPEAGVPVGEFLAAISAALLGEGADGD